MAPGGNRGRVRGPDPAFVSDATLDDAGVRLPWVIHPEARYAVAYRPDRAAHVLRERESLDGEDVLPGFHLPLDRIFD